MAHKIERADGWISPFVLIGTYLEQFLEHPRNLTHTNARKPRQLRRTCKDVCSTLQEIIMSMEELLEEIQEIQKHLYGGFKEEGDTNVDWLEVRRLK